MTVESINGLASTKQRGRVRWCSWWLTIVPPEIPSLMRSFEGESGLGGSIGCSRKSPIPSLFSLCLLCLQSPPQSIASFRLFFKDFGESRHQRWLKQEVQLYLFPTRTKEISQNRNMKAHNSGVRGASLIPQLFTIIPALGGAASCLSGPKQPTWRAWVTDEQELVPLLSEHNCELHSRGHLYASERHESSSGLPGLADLVADGTQSDDDIRGDATDLSSETNSLLAESTSASTPQSRISLFQGLVERARRTAHGSADDIGWLQRDRDMPGVEDGTERFMEILDSIRHGVHRLPNSMIYLLIPGLFSNHGPLYFCTTKAFLSKMGLTCHIAKIHSEASVETNAIELKEHIEEIYWGSQKRVMLLGHSKGGIDAAAALTLYWHDLKDKVAGLVLAQSPYGGTPIASDILREGQLGDYVNVRKMMEFMICKVMKGDMQALEDLTYDKRREFVKRHQLPKELPVVSVHTEANISPAVLVTLSHVAHAELGQAAKLPVMIPLGAAMAACAQLLQVRYGEKSDGLVTCRDAEVPGSVVVRPTRKLDHAWMVYSSSNDDPSEANASEVCEALLTLLFEVGEKKRRELGLVDG